MRATPKEFNHTYVMLVLKDGTSESMETIKNRLKEEKSVHYVDILKKDKNDENLNFENNTDREMIIFMKEGNPIDAFIKASSDLCDFSNGMPNVRNVEWNSNYPRTSLWYNRYKEFIGVLTVQLE